MSCMFFEFFFVKRSGLNVVIVVRVVEFGEVVIEE